MKAKQIYLQDTDQTVELGGGGAGTAINTSVYFASDPKDAQVKQNIGKLLIRCNVGEIQEGDSVRFFHNVNNRMRSGNTTVARYHGWVEPRKVFPVSLEFIGNRGEYDLWAVTTDAQGAISFADYERMRVENEIDKTQNLSLQKKCGVAIFRNGIRITDYIKFRVAVNQDYRCFLARW